MKENKAKTLAARSSPSAGTYQEAKFADDAETGARSSTRTTATSRAQVGQPQVETVEDSKDGKTR